MKWLRMCVCGGSVRTPDAAEEGAEGGEVLAEEKEAIQSGHIISLEAAEDKPLQTYHGAVGGSEI